MFDIFFIFFTIKLILEKILKYVLQGSLLVVLNDNKKIN